jgi:hypothetical protein
MFKIHLKNLEHMLLGAKTPRRGKIYTIIGLQARQVSF